MERDLSPADPVIIVSGPTAVGKSELAVALAEALDAEVVSVDSAMVFRGMDIGTAKPDPATRARIPHHLIDILDPTEIYSAARFRRDGLAAIECIQRRGRRVILAGGTMLYLRALLHGIADLPTADPALRSAIKLEAASRGWQALHRELRTIDPEAAERIHPNDPQRIQRALEVYRATGEPLTRVWERRTVPGLLQRSVHIGVRPADRCWLRARIAERFHAMLDAGLVAEVAALHRRGDLSLANPSMRSVGYRQVWEYLNGALDEAELAARAIDATRQLAKRQLTWMQRFKHDYHVVAEHMGSSEVLRWLIPHLAAR